VTAQAFGAPDKLSRQVADTAAGTITFAGSPPVNVPGATAGQTLVSDSAGNLTPQTPASSFTMGLQYLTGGGAITASTITTAQGAGYTGLFLDPRYVWTMHGVSLAGISDFTIESRMAGNIGGGTVAYNTGGYIDTGSGADGIQVYSGNPVSTPTQGLVLRGLVFVGANSNAVAHFGGGQRSCAVVDCLFYNTNSASGAYGLITDTALANYLAEGNSFTRCSIAGAYAALGIGTADAGQHAADTTWDNPTTAGGTYSIVADAGGEHHFINHYDRSSPSTAVVYNHGAVLYFDGGGDYNNNASGVAHLLDSAGAVTVLTGREIIQGTNTTTITISAGSLVARGRTKWAGVVALSGTGNVDLSDPAGSYGALTISGSAGKLMLAGNYNPGSGPTVTGWTGVTLYQGSAMVASQRGAGQTTTQTVTWTPPPQSVKFRVSVMVHPTVAGTSTVPSVGFTEYGGLARSYAIPMWRQDGSSTAPSYLCAAADTFLGEVVSDTDNSGTPVQVMITPTGSTFRYSVVIEQITGQ